ncbi:MAG: transcription termination/antitermination protein NusG [Rickettsiales bacterium]|jgi:transcriptional antiterminator NusG|nr:transcription termination/antitermination protein NusG [Rickettsiales bacterium]
MAKWYIINVIAGQEQVVCDEINNTFVKINSDIKEAFVPLKKVFKYSRGKKIETTQKIYPNYVFVNMEMNKKSHSQIRDISKVMKFLGSKDNPGAVTETEMEKIKNMVERENSEEIKDTYEVGDLVKIIDGHFESFVGSVESINKEKNTLKISVSIFGRPTMVDIEVDKVERV